MATCLIISIAAQDALTEFRREKCPLGRFFREEMDIGTITVAPPPLWRQPRRPWQQRSEIRLNAEGR